MTEERDTRPSALEPSSTEESPAQYWERRQRELAAELNKDPEFAKVLERFVITEQSSSSSLTRVAETVKRIDGLFGE